MTGQKDETVGTATSGKAQWGRPASRRQKTACDYPGLAHRCLPTTHTLMEDVQGSGLPTPWPLVTVFLKPASLSPFSELTLKRHSGLSDSVHRLCSGEALWAVRSPTGLIPIWVQQGRQAVKWVPAD